MSTCLGRLSSLFTYDEQTWQKQNAAPIRKAERWPLVMCSYIVITHWATKLLLNVTTMFSEHNQLYVLFLDYISDPCLCSDLTHKTQQYLWIRNRGNLQIRK